MAICHNLQVADLGFCDRKTPISGVWHQPPRRVLSNWRGSRCRVGSAGLVGGVGACGVLWAVRVGARGVAAGAHRVNAPPVWVMPRLVRRVRLTAAALVVSQRWLAATPR